MSYGCCEHYMLPRQHDLAVYQMYAYYLEIPIFINSYCLESYIVCILVCIHNE